MMVLLKKGKKKVYNDVGASDKSNNCNDDEFMTVGIVYNAKYIVYSLQFIIPNIKFIIVNDL